MSIFGIITMFGSLALFLYGMSLMSDGLIKISGSRIEAIIEKLTKSTPKAILFGTVVTAVIQSSSALTVMVVGFVNAGFMGLQQAIGVIMGANIGTTITSWILSLTGIESSNFWVQLLKPETFSPIIAIIGIVIFFTNTNNKKRLISEAMIGFAILMFGMSSMSQTMKPLAHDPGFTNFIVLFDNPILSLLAGAIFTAVLQSSSASVGTLQALSLTGALSVNATIPIIFGQNIGTCITAVLSTFGTNRNAKRTALAHLCFNIIGSIVFMIVYFVLLKFFDVPFFKQTATPFTIAVVHSVFNITVTLISFC